MATSPTQRTLAALRRDYPGCVVGIVEHFNPWVKRRQDLFGWMDILVLIGCNTVGIQCTSGANHSHRREKILSEPRALAWLKAGNIIEVHSWAKRGARGKAKRWECRKEELTESDFQEAK